MAPVHPSLGILHLLQQSPVAERFLAFSMCFLLPSLSLRVVICIFHQEKCLKKGTVQMWQLGSYQSSHNHCQDVTATPSCSSVSPALSVLFP